MRLPKKLQPYTRIVQKKSLKEQISLLDAFKIAYHFALIFGIGIGLLYFSFVVEMLPNIKEISQIISYLIAIFGVALVFVLFFSFLMVIPSSILSIEAKKINSLDNYAISIFFGFPFVAHIIINLIFVFLFKISLFAQYPIMLILSNVFLLALALFFFYKKGYRDSLFLYVVYWLISFVFILYFFIAIDTTENFDFFIQVCVIISICLIVVLANIYAFTKNKLLIDKTINVIELVKYISTISFLFILITTITSLLTNSQNPILVKPFSVLKIGNYIAKFDFKKDFLSRKNLFPFNDTNQTSNIFIVLSSAGDEYILKERYPLKLINATTKNLDINIVHYIENKHFWEEDIDKVYWFNNNLCWDKHKHVGNLNYTVNCPKDFSITKQEMINDPLLISKLKEKQIIPKDDVYPLKIKVNNELFIKISKYNGKIYWFTKNFCWEQYEDIGNLDKIASICPSDKVLENSKNINYQIFKVNKNDVNEIIGEAFQNKTTTWVINPK